MRRPTTVAQKPPDAYVDVIINFILYVQKLWKKNDYKFVYACDETAVWLDPSGGTYVSEKGAKSVTVLNTSHEKARVTVILTARSDGVKLPPFVLLPKKRTVPEIVRRFKNKLVLSWCGRTWMDNELTTKYLEEVFGNFFFGNRLFIWDSSRIGPRFWPQNTALLLRFRNTRPKILDVRGQRAFFLKKLPRGSGGRPNGCATATGGNWSTKVHDKQTAGCSTARGSGDVEGQIPEILKEPEFQCIEKIKTIATTYMAASGLTGSSTDNSHVVAVVNFALALFGGPEELNENSSGNFNLHIGRDVGPVVVGVIGTEKPHYDIWGIWLMLPDEYGPGRDSGTNSGRVTDETKQILEREGFHSSAMAKSPSRQRTDDHLFAEAAEGRGAAARRRRSSAIPSMNQQSHGQWADGRRGEISDPIIIPPRPKDQNTPDVILDELMKLEQSYRELNLFEQEASFIVTTYCIPEGHSSKD
uniref:adenylate cyclase n=1 Tax=Globodera rostochiensis TaxID=31243 RepID=A0A914I9L4_GLORO